MAIPDGLRALPQWVLWRQETREGKPTKVPYRANGDGRASTTNPDTWATFDQADAALAQGNWDGLGFVFTEDDPFCGVDIDKAMTGGSLHPAAVELIKQLDSYTEWSPSGNGVHVIARGCVPADGPKKVDAPWGTNAIERYSTGRFFTMTGRHYMHSPLEVNSAQRAVDSIAPENGGRATPPVVLEGPQNGLQDDEILALARGARNGGKFTALYDQGDTSEYGGDDSAADQALCNLLAFWTGRDPEQMDRLLRASKLMRPKWDRNAKQGETYGQGTIRKAVEDCDEVYQRPAVRPAPPALPDGVTGAQVLDGVVRFINRYVVMPSPQAVDAVALFVAHTHGIEAADTCPYLHVTSPEKRAGKTVLLDVITPLVGSALPAVSASAAAIYRGIVEDGVRRTLVLDEVDAVFTAKGSEQAEALRQVLNAGTRRGATVIRCNGNTGKNETFDPFGPKVLGGIADVPATLADRCITIPMTRATPEQVAELEPARYRVLVAGAQEHHELLAGWVASVEDRAADLRPTVVPGITSRAMDAWEPLLALAELAGEQWAARATAAALALSKDDPEAGAQDNIYRRILTACVEVMGADQFLPSEDLVDRLKSHDSEWQFLNSGGLTTTALARLLRRWRVKPERSTGSGLRQRGYTQAALRTAHATWIGPPEDA